MYLITSIQNQFNFVIIILEKLWSCGEYFVLISKCMPRHKEEVPERNQIGKTQNKLSNAQLNDNVYVCFWQWKSNTLYFHNVKICLTYKQIFFIIIIT